MTGSSQNDDDDGTVGQTLARHYLATTRNWSICGSLSWLLGSHTLVSSFSWIRLSDSPEKQVITVIYLCFICSASWGTDFIWPTLFFREVCLIVKFSGSAHLRLACQGSPPGIWSPHGSHPDLPGVSSGQGQTPASRKNSPVGDDHPNITPGSQNYFNPVSFLFHAAKQPTLTTMGVTSSDIPPFPGNQPKCLFRWGGWHYISLWGEKVRTK